MKFTDWYEVEKDAKVLIVEKNTETIEQYKNNKYDYIYLNGILENANKFFETTNPYFDLLVFFKGLLTEKGTLFIAVNNAKGVQYIAGKKSEHCKKIYDSLENQFDKGKLFTKKELEKIISTLGLKNKKMYYPLPNYEIPNVIFTDNYLPDNSNSKLNYNVIYNEESLVIQSEINLLKIMISEEKFTEFTNSYIVELSNRQINNNFKYYSFNNMRKDKYSLILKMNDEYVIKTPQTKEALEHIKNINNIANKLREKGFDIAEEGQQDIVKSKLIKYPQFDSYLMSLVEENKVEEVYKAIDNWYDYLQDKLKPDDKGFVKDGFIDMVFENTFYNKAENEYVFFDQEWYKENIPIKFIMYRAIKNLYAHNPKIENVISEEKILNRYDIKNDEYQKQEEQMQEEIIDNDKRKFYSKQYEYMIKPEEIKQIIKDVKKINKDNAELVEGVEYLKNQIREKDNIIKELEQEKISDKIFKKFKSKTNKKG